MGRNVTFLSLSESGHIGHNLTSCILPSSSECCGSATVPQGLSLRMGEISSLPLLDCWLLWRHPTVAQIPVVLYPVPLNPKLEIKLLYKICLTYGCFASTAGSPHTVQVTNITETSIIHFLGVLRTLNRWIPAEYFSMLKCMQILLLSFLLLYSIPDRLKILASIFNLYFCIRKNNFCDSK